jgi:hypothetical protein
MCLYLKYLSREIYQKNINKLLDRIIRKVDFKDMEVEKMDHAENIKTIPPTLIPKLRDWLGYDGCAFFSVLKETFGTVYRPPGGFPPFYEGTKVRNFMRGCPECEGWTDQELDDNWSKAVELAIQ